MKFLKPDTSNHPFAPVIARIVLKGDRYGRDGCLVHQLDQPMLEFYDERYKHNDWIGEFNGQFVSRYYLATLIESRHRYGLILDGGITEWQVKADVLHEVLTWARNTTGIKVEEYYR